MIKELFAKNTGIPSREKEMIKNVTDEDCINGLIGNVRVSAVGLFELKSKKQKKKKQKKNSEKKSASPGE